MSEDKPLICLITPGHVASTPRLVKNADALAEAGYRVHVIAGRHYPAADSLDAEIFAQARWRHTLVDYCGGPGVLARKFLRRLARRLVVRPPFATVPVAARAHNAEAPRFAALAAAVPAELYLGHGLAGLPAAAAAARTRGRPFGFDAEDYHDEETEEARSHPAERAARRVLQATLLPECPQFTTAAPLISKRYEDVYQVAAITLLNVFPLAQAPAEPAAAVPIGRERPAVFYWFSQTIGAGRGLEKVITVLGQMRTPAELHLRGFIAPGFAEQLGRLASAAGLPRPIRFLAPGAPAEMVRLAAGADLGLSTEESHPLNRDLCLTNKIFAYLLAGIPQLLSTTAAQSALAPELGPAVLLANLGDPSETARRLDAFFADGNRVTHSRQAAWELGRRRFNWDLEKEVLLNSVGALLAMTR